MIMREQRNMKTFGSIWNTVQNIFEWPQRWWIRHPTSVLGALWQPCNGWFQVVRDHTMAGSIAD